MVQDKQTLILEKLTENRSPGIRSWPKFERPIERLFEHGPRALSLSELLAILIGHGSRGQSALDLAKQIVSTTRDYTSPLSNLSLALLLRVKGLGPTKASRILAALELARRSLEQNNVYTSPIKSSDCVATLIRTRVVGLPFETFYVMALDIKNRPTLISEVARGNSEGVWFLPRDAFSEAVRAHASGVICVHNHPSGDPTPSNEDRRLTIRLKNGAELLGLRFLDHVIVTTNQHYSFAESEPLLFC